MPGLFNQTDTRLLQLPSGFIPSEKILVPILTEGAACLLANISCYSSFYLPQNVQPSVSNDSIIRTEKLWWCDRQRHYAIYFAGWLYGLKAHWMDEDHCASGEPLGKLLDFDVTKCPQTSLLRRLILTRSRAPVLPNRSAWSRALPHHPPKTLLDGCRTIQYLWTVRHTSLIVQSFPNIAAWWKIFLWLWQAAAPAAGCLSLKRCR